MAPQNARVACGDGPGVLEIVLLATMLAPTDAALGKAVVTNESVPTDVRESLNVESGLKDGICVPVLFVFLALATGSEAEGGTTMLTLSLVAEEIGIGLAVGFGLTYSLGSFSWQVVLYSVLSLTAVGMLPVFLVLAGTGLRTDEKLFMGWFGPRGLASIVFGVIVLQQHLPGGGTISMTVVRTILFSVIGHGLTANPLARALGARVVNGSAAGVSGEKD